jgi:hypothetical protein
MRLDMGWRDYGKLQQIIPIEICSSDRRQDFVRTEADTKDERYEVCR